jgi:hypothetical protein
LNNTLLNDWGRVVIKDTREKIKKFPEPNENENKTYQNM